MGAALGRRRPARVMNRPEAIRLCFDKDAVHGVLETAGVARPERLPAARSFAEVRDAMRAAGWSQAFVKPCHSSTASGVIALRSSRQGAIAVTSLEQVALGGEHRFYNSFRLRRYESESDVARAVDFVLGEHAVVERWIPKLTIGDAAVDVRVVVIDAQAQHRVARASRRPITNLHLRSRRLPVDGIRERVGAAAWEAGVAAAAAASRACGCGYSGVDLLFSPSGRHAVLEVNAFGDLLPGLLHEGRDTYAAELEAAGRVA
jgi:glutathione synthase/RimK-type ligase-like ATP-grasp enzyme